MGRKALVVLAASLAAGLIARAAWGGFAGAGALAAVAVAGALWIVLRRNQKDLRELEAGRVPPEVDRALGEPPPEP